MTRYLISFDDGDMDFPESDFEEVGRVTQAVVREAKAAGVWVVGAGLRTQRAKIANIDETIVDGPFPEIKAVIGGFCIVEVSSLDEALRWATKFAVSCRCAQEVRELMNDPQA